MAKKSVIERQKKRERQVQLNWDKRQALKKRSCDLNISEEERALARTSLDKMSPNTSPVRLRNRCQLTGRPRGCYQKFKMSRMKFRELASMGMIPGVTKASW